MVMENISKTLDIPESHTFEVQIPLPWQRHRIPNCRWLLRNGYYLYAMLRPQYTLASIIPWFVRKYQIIATPRIAILANFPHLHAEQDEGTWGYAQSWSTRRHGLFHSPNVCKKFGILGHSLSS